MWAGQFAMDGQDRFKCFAFEIPLDRTDSALAGCRQPEVNASPNGEIFLWMSKVVTVRMLARSAYGMTIFSLGPRNAMARHPWEFQLAKATARGLWQRVSEFIAFGRQILGVEFVWRRDDGYLINHGQVKSP